MQSESFIAGQDASLESTFSTLLAERSRLEPVAGIGATPCVRLCDRVTVNAPVNVIGKPHPRAAQS